MTFESEKRVNQRILGNCEKRRPKYANHSEICDVTLMSPSQRFGCKIFKEKKLSFVSYDNNNFSPNKCKSTFLRSFFFY